MERKRLKKEKRWLVGDIVKNQGGDLSIILGIEGCGLCTGWEYCNHNFMIKIGPAGEWSNGKSDFSEPICSVNFIHIPGCKRR